MRLLLLLLLLWQPGQALAHAALLEISPADGATLESAPPELRLRFDEPVGLIALSLAGPDGAVTLDGAAAANDVVSARVPPGLTRGTYLLSWRVTSADSHPVAGSIAFGIGVAPQAGRTAAPDRWTAPSMAARALFLAALLLTAGGALFRMVANLPARVRTALGGIAWAGIALAALQVGLRGALLADAPSLLARSPWLLGAGTTLAASLAVSATGLAACAWALRRDRLWPGIAAGSLALAGLPLSGHAGTADPRWLTAPALLLHALSAAFWIGALWPLLSLLRGRDSAATLRRFSAAAIPAVALLLVSGATLAAIQLGSWTALPASPYGRLLCLKAALVLALLALAAWNNRALTPALAAGATPARLRTSIRAELTLAAFILAVTAVLGLTPPPRAQARPAGTTIYTQAANIPALIEITPARRGQNRIAVTFGRPRPPIEVWLELRQPAADVAAIRRPLRPEAGQWVHEGPEIALPGRWTLRIEALMTEFDQTNFTTEIDIP